MRLTYSPRSPTAANNAAFVDKMRKTIEVHPGTVRPCSQRIPNINESASIRNDATTPQIPRTLNGFVVKPIAELIAKEIILETGYLDLPAYRGSRIISRL